MKDERNYSDIPAAACCMVVGPFELGDNGPDAKTAPVRLVARSGKPIEHWYWGRVVHDLAGMHLHKSHIPIDYVHDAKEVIGYLNRFDTESGDLITSGALVPFKDSDRATEIIHKMAAGVPYEASINFGGDGLKVQEIPEGQVAEVNGFRFEGPVIIVREWPLRGVAICPYGADMNTESSAFAGGNKAFHASVVEVAPVEESVMPDIVEAAVEETTDIVVEDQELTQEPVDAVEEEAPEQVEELEHGTDEPKLDIAEEAVEPEAEEDPAEEDAPAELSRDEFCRIVDEFGAEIAAQTVKNGGDYNTALKAFADAQTQELTKARERIAELEAAQSSGRPAKVNEMKDTKPLIKIQGR